MIMIRCIGWQIAHDGRRRQDRAFNGDAGAHRSAAGHRQTSLRVAIVDMGTVAGS
jgi:hypothetical protein